ncbi:MAG: hypothetical protein ACE5JX_12920 [Acidobacteriota bacterium]
MAVYILYDKKTGQPLHTHIEPEESRSSLEELVERVNPSLECSKVDMVLVDDREVDRIGLARVDPANRRLVAPGKVKVGGFGGGGGGSVHALEGPPSARVHIRKAQR